MVANVTLLEKRTSVYLGRSQERVEKEGLTRKQDCTVEVPEFHRQLMFAFGWLEKPFFLYMNNLKCRTSA